MDSRHLRTVARDMMSDPEWIALESLDEKTGHFVFDDGMLSNLHQRGLVEPRGPLWRVTAHGRRALGEHNEQQV